jgi:uncharacterized protein
MKKMKKQAIAMALGTTLMLTTVAPAIHAQQQVPEVSNWAIEALNEGEKFGIFPPEWYFENFQAAISADRLSTLIDLTEKKVASLNLKKNDKFTPVEVKGDNTREDIVNRLYNVIAQYDVNANNDPVSYLQQRQILRGDAKGLQLDQQATTEQAVIFAIRLIKDIYATAEQGAKGVAWVVEDEDTKIYLLGSIHLGIPDLYPFNTKLTNAFDESEGLFLEANILDPEGNAYSMEKATYSDGQTLQQSISQETYTKLQKVADKIGLSMEQLNVYKPWVISNNLSIYTMTMDDAFGLSAAEMANYGIDTQFLLSAMLKQKPIYELEGMKAQIDMLDGLSPEYQEESLDAMLDFILEPGDDKNEGVALLDSWFDSWKRGDVEAFTESFVAMEGEQTEFDQMLFGKRDEEMAKKIVSVLENQVGTYFLVVGAGHFVVDKNIRYHLEQSGYDVVPFYE